MEGIFLHERLYRGEELLKKFGQAKIIICGVGALGGNLCVNLARHGFWFLTVLDRDRVESHNLPTQPYGQRDIGALKAPTLAGRIFREIGTAGMVAHAVELTAKNIGKLLGGNDLAVDVFDNRDSRQLVKDFCLERKIPCLHAGMSADGYSEVVWNDQYRVPRDVGSDICDYPLARNLIEFTVALASEAVIEFVASGVKQGFAFTLKDKKVHQR